MFRFTVETIDDDTNEVQRTVGYLGAISYVHAMGQVVKFFEPEAIVSVELVELTNPILACEMADDIREFNV